MPRSAVRLVTLAALSLPLTACGEDAEAGDEGALEVQASFYPLAFLAEQVGGEHTAVSNLTAAGADPHDVELSPRQVGGIKDADLVVYAAGLQPAVDDAVESRAAGHSLDVNASAGLQQRSAEPVGDDADQGHGHDHGSGPVDTHFWLDPLRYGDVAQTIAGELAEVDPTNAADYQANAAELVQQLERLDGELASGLASCTQEAMVTSHSAFGYLADRYGFTQVGITGLSPESEPTPGRLAEIASYVREHDVSTIYSEVLLDPAVAQTVARETGAEVAVLDPLEGISEDSAGSDYFEVMRANLETLRAGQGCS